MPLRRQVQPQRRTQQLARPKLRLSLIHISAQLPVGKQSIKELIGQNQGVSSIPIEKTDLKGFEQVARKYGVDYAITKDQNVIPPKYTVFFLSLIHICVYMSDSILDQVIQHPEVIYTLAQELVAEREQLEGIRKQLDAAQPKADYFDTFVNSEDCTCIRNFCKEIGIPEKTAVALLLDHRYLYRSPSGWLIDVYKRQVLPG